MADKKQRKSAVVSLRKGAIASPSAVPANYCEEIPDEVFDLIEKECDQEILSDGKIIDKFDW